MKEIRNFRSDRGTNTITLSKLWILIKSQKVLRYIFLSISHTPLGAMLPIRVRFRRQKRMFHSFTHLISSSRVLDHMNMHTSSIVLEICLCVCSVLKMTVDAKKNTTKCIIFYFWSWSKAPRELNYYKCEHSLKTHCDSCLMLLWSIGSWWVCGVCVCVSSAGSRCGRRTTGRVWTRPRVWSRSSDTTSPSRRCCGSTSRASPWGEPDEPEVTPRVKLRTGECVWQWSWFGTHGGWASLEVCAHTVIFLTKRTHSQAVISFHADISHQYSALYSLWTLMLLWGRLSRSGLLTEGSQLWSTFICMIVFKRISWNASGHIFRDAMPCHHIGYRLDKKICPTY